jgi:hypothetical protein
VLFNMPVIPLFCDNVAPAAQTFTYSVVTLSPPDRKDGSGRYRQLVSNLTLNGASVSVPGGTTPLFARLERGLRLVSKSDCLSSVDGPNRFSLFGHGGQRCPLRDPTRLVRHRHHQHQSGGTQESPGRHRTRAPETARSPSASPN